MRDSHHHHRTALVAEYGAMAGDYDRRWSFYTRATLAETLRRMPPPEPGAALLDIGCGTGQLLAALSQRHPDCRLTGLDPVEAMLSQARRRVPASVVLLEGWADALPLADASQDQVLSCNMFHYLTDPERALAEIRRVLKPGGALVVTDWCHDFVSCKLCDAWLRLANSAHRPAYRQADCAALLQAAGWRLEHSERYKINWLWGMMTLVARPAGEAR